MMETNDTPNIHGNFVSEKINKIRWRPDAFNNSHFFVTGSWDNEINNIKLWDFRENEEEQDVYPILINEHPFKGDITELQFIDFDNFVVSSTNGSAYLMDIKSSRSEILINKKREWANLHKFPSGDSSPCTSFAVYNTDIVTVGEDGSINFLNANTENLIRTIKNGDSCSINCVSFLRHNEILTANFHGTMKIWDLRKTEDEPISTLNLSRDQVTPTCLQFHPTQRHIIVAGDEDGTLTVWDLRRSIHPINVLNAHDSSVNEIQFHPEHPDHVFTCSSTGDIWHWSSKKHPVDTSFWLSSGQAVTNQFEVFTLMPQLHKPINSFDLNRDKVICGCDNEAVYLINHLQLYQ